MREQRELPAELLWQEDGHVSDVVLDTLADGQEELVPVSAREHVDACEPCGQRLGNAVFLALQVGEALQQKLQSHVAQPQGWPIPIPAVLAAIALAAFGSLPVLGDLIERASELLPALVSLMPNLTRAVLAMTRTGEVGTQLAYLSVLAVAVLILGGFVIARAIPRESALQRSVR